MFGIPAPTAYDLNFRLLNIPVRVSPWFWIIAAVMGWRGGDLLGVVIWIACVFVSIMVHEYGHGLTARALVQQQPSIVLHGMGGLCFYDRESRSPWGRVAVLAMGPGAGFLLAALIGLIGYVTLGVYPTFSWDHWLGFGIKDARGLMLLSKAPYVGLIYLDLMQINILWGIFNLLPIYPLDGGQLAASFLSMHDRNEGQRRAYIVSFVTASLIALYFFREGYKDGFNNGTQYNALFIGYLALINFQLLQAATMQRRYGDVPDDDNWWRR